MKKERIVDAKKSAIVRKYVERHQQPIQDLCPVLVQYWRKSNGNIVLWDSLKGRRREVSDIKNNFEYRPWEESDNFIDNVFKDIDCERLLGYGPYSVSRQYESVYICDTGKGMIEIACIQIDGNRGKDGEPKKWKYTNRYCYSSRFFIFKEDVMVYNDKGNDAFPDSWGVKYNKAFVNELRAMSKLSVSQKALTQIVVKDGFCKSFYYYRESETSDSPYCFYELINWYKNLETEKAISKHTECERKLLDTKLTPIKDISKQYEDRNFPFSSIAHFETVNDKYAVFRVLRRKQTWNYGTRIYEVENDYTIETERIYISQKGKVITAKKQGEDKFVRKGILATCFLNVYIANMCDVEKWKPLSYIKDIVNSTLVTHRLIHAIQLLRYPILEKLYKAGYAKIENSLFYSFELNKDILIAFGKVKNKGNLYQMLGCNKYMLNAVEQLLENHPVTLACLYNGARECLAIINAVKQILGREDITDLSKETVEFYVNGLKDLSDPKRWKREIFSHAGCWRYSVTVKELEKQDYSSVLTDEQRNKVNKLIKLQNKNNRAIELFRDTNRLLDNLHDNIEFRDEYLKSFEELAAFHDNVVRLFNVYQENRRALYDATEAEKAKKRKEMFEKLQDERREHFNFTTEDDSFLIKIPEELSEITTEGSVLRHCVGGYVDSHAIGDTNIIFLRKKSEPNVPLFTIEVRGNEVRQIHGFGNRWLGNLPEAINFTYRWVKEKKLRCYAALLLEKGTGYGASGQTLNAEDYGVKADAFGYCDVFA